MGLFDVTSKKQTPQELEKESDGILDIFSKTVTDLAMNSTKAEAQQKIKQEEADRLMKEADILLKDKARLGRLVVRNTKIAGKMKDFLS